MVRYTFGKKEKLCSKLVIEKLFKTGKGFKEYPFRVVYLPLELSDSTAKLLISVPKKKFKRAVARNKIKRMVREAYRLNKPELIENWTAHGKYFALAFVYIGNDIPEYADLTKNMQRILETLKSV